MARALQTVFVTVAAATLIIAALSYSLIVDVLALGTFTLLIVLFLIRAWRRAGRQVDAILASADDPGSLRDDVSSGSVPNGTNRDITRT